MGDASDAEPEAIPPLAALSLGAVAACDVAGGASALDVGSSPRRGEVGAKHDGGGGAVLVVERPAAPTARRPEPSGRASGGAALASGRVAR